MAIKRYFAIKDNTITNAFKENLTSRGTTSNMGAADILEVFSIYGQASSASSELSRVLIQFDVNELNSDRTAGSLPASGSVSFYLKMFNAPHGQTLPKQFDLEVKPVSASWDEGTGLDMELYKDIGKSNWVSASTTAAWTTAGGDYYSGSALVRTQNFDAGTEDLEIDVSEVVERQLKYITEGIGASVVYVYFQSASPNSYDPVGAPNNHTIKLTNTSGGSQTFTFDRSTNDTTNGTIGVQTAVTTNTADIASQFVAAVNDSTVSSLGITATLVTSISSDGRLVKLEQDIGGTAGDTSILMGNSATSETSEANTFIALYRFFRESAVIPTFDKDTGYLQGSTTVQFFDGVNTLPNYGFGIALTGSQETALRSYYTKKFFARGTEFHFKKPVIEARWNSSVQDDRANFFYSSSLATAAENLNTIYLYNYFRGRLRNIPSIGTGSIYVSFFSGSSDDTAPSGSAITLVADGTHVLSASPTVVTGGYVSTGIYSASVALTAAATPVATLYDVWHNGDLTTQFQTGTISPEILKNSMTAPSNEYVLSITNMKPAYRPDETARFRLFTRQKDWNPTIYTRAVATPEVYIVESGSYEVYRVVDDLKVIPYGTGSDGETIISYDASGSYFDLDMSMLESGYMYGINFAFYNQDIGEWVEQPDTFKFKVETKRQS